MNIDSQEKKLAHYSRWLCFQNPSVLSGWNGGFFLPFDFCAIQVFFGSMIFDHYQVRLIAVTDAAQLFALVNNNKGRISDYLPRTAATIISPETAEQYISQKLKETEQREHYCMVVEDTFNHKLAGVFFIKNFDWNIPKCELGYFVDRSYEGQGIASGTMAAVVQFCFDTLQVQKIFLRTGIDNIASRKAAEKNGFVLEGILRWDFKLQDGSLTDLAYYGKIRD